MHVGNTREPQKPVEINLIFFWRYWWLNQCWFGLAYLKESINMNFKRPLDQVFVNALANALANSLANSWTHLRTRYWGVFTLQGLKDLLRGFGLWYCESWGIGENEKVKHDSTTQSFFCRCCWNRRGVILFSVVRKITASRENRGEPLGDQVVKTADSQATSAG